jgi:biofilm PGA synthesis N-glycosyltransferase PgaC
MQWRIRFVGIGVLALTGSVAGILWVAVGDDPIPVAPTREGVLFGALHYLYADDVPPLAVIYAAIATAAFLVALVFFFEQQIVLRYRRSAGTRSRPLTPRIVMAQTIGFRGEVTVTVVVPAHNEEATLPATLTSLWAQSHVPRQIIVVADNCTDSTVEVAAAHGARVILSVGNTDKKAGALNQALAEILPDQGENDVVMVMDADTTLRAGFLEHAVRRFRDDRALMAVGGVFYGEEGHGFLGIFQRNEYARYGREIGRRRGRVFVLTGTASLFRPRALRFVAAARGTVLPGRTGDVYDVAALTEDNELTIALKTLGGLMMSPLECSVETELMPTWRALWNQRLRWQRGALENLGAYGFTPVTFRYWAQQLGIGYGVFALVSYLVLLIIMVLAIDRWVWFPFWIGLGGIFLVERVVTAWRTDWRGRMTALLVFPELAYDLFIQLVFVKGIVDMSLAREAGWKHLSETDGQTSARPEA